MEKKLGFGLMRLPLTEEGNPKSIDQETVNRMVDHFLENGFTYFDTGYPYHQGMSEVAAKRALVDRYPREAFTLTDKMPTFIVTCKEDYDKFFDEQLRRCGVEYFDYYLLHNLGEKNYANTLRHDGFAFIRRLKAEGKAKRIGFSYHDKAELLDRILTDHPEMEYVQLQINYADWENETIEARKCYEVATRHKKPVIVMEPVKGGSLADVPQEAEQLFQSCRPGMSAASWAVRFTASLDNVCMVLSGMSDFAQVVDNVGYMRAFTPLDETEREIVEKVTAIMHSSIAIPCTACQYCVDDCPQNIPIPQYFSLYNDQKRFKLVPAHKNYYMNLAQRSGKAADCIACGQCEQHCPQRIEIVERLKEVSAVFDEPT